MKLIMEYYPKRQGRPQPRELIDLESGQNPLLFRYLSLKEEYGKMEKLLDKLLNEQIQQINKMVDEAAQIKLHLASISDASIEPGDGEDAS